MKLIKVMAHTSYYTPYSSPDNIGFSFLETFYSQSETYHAGISILHFKKCPLIFFHFFLPRRTARFDYRLVVLII